MDLKKSDSKDISSLEITTPLIAQSRVFSKDSPSRGFYKHPLRHGSKSPEIARPYIPGDPLKLIDWRSFARTENLIIREEAKTARKKVLILCDLAPSMYWPEEDFYKKSKQKPIINKVFFSSRIALHLAYQHKICDNRTFLGFLKDDKIFAKEISRKEELVHLDKNLREDFFYLNKALESCFFELEYNSSFHSFYFLSDHLTTKESIILPQSQEKYFFHTLSSYELDTEWISKEFHYCKNLKSRSKFLGEKLKKNNFFQNEFNAWLRKKSETYAGKGFRYFLISDLTKLSEYLKYISL